MFFGIGNRWKNWKPTNEYLLVVNKLDTITKLHEFIQQFKYKWDKITILFWKVLWDWWQMPDESVEKMKGDCEDAAILTADVLGRIQKRDDVRFIVSFGYCIWNGKKKLMGHAVTAFKNNPYNNKYSIFSNNQLEHNFTDFIEIGHRFYPLGLKFMQVRDWRGKVLNNKFLIFGVF